MTYSNAQFLIVGINHHYQEEYTLKSAEQDAKNIYKIFNYLGLAEERNTTLLTGKKVTPERIREELDKLNQIQKDEGSKDILLIYWAGHAEKLSGQEQVVLLTSKTNSQENFNQETISILTIVQNHQFSGFQRCVLILDTCHSGVATKNFESNINAVGAFEILTASTAYSEARESIRGGYLTVILIEEIECVLEEAVTQINLSSIFSQSLERLKNEKDQTGNLLSYRTGQGDIKLKVYPKKTDWGASSETTDRLETAIGYATKAFREYLNANIVGGVELIYFLGFDVWDGCLVYDGLIHGSIEQQLLNFIRNKFIDRDRLRSKYEEIGRHENQTLGVAGCCLYKAREAFEKILNFIINQEKYSEPFKNPTLSGLEYIGDLKFYQSEYDVYDSLLGLRSCLYIPVIENLINFDGWSNGDRQLTQRVQSELSALKYQRRPLGGVLIAANRKAYGLLPRDPDNINNFITFLSSLPDQLFWSSDNPELTAKITRIKGLSQAPSSDANQAISELLKDQDFQEKIISLRDNEAAKYYFKNYDAQITDKLRSLLQDENSIDLNSKKLYHQIRDTQFRSFINCIGTVYIQKAERKLGVRQGLHPRLIKASLTKLKDSLNKSNNNNFSEEKIQGIIQKISLPIEIKLLQYNQSEQFINHLEQYGCGEFILSIQGVDEKHLRDIVQNYLIAIIWRNIGIEILSEEKNRGSITKNHLKAIQHKTIPKFLRPADLKDNLSWVNYIHNRQIIRRIQYPIIDNNVRKDQVRKLIIDLINDLVDDIRETQHSHFDFVFNCLKAFAPVENYITNVSQIEGLLGGSVREQIFFDVSHSILVWLLGLWVLDTEVETSSNKAVRDIVIERMINYFRQELISSEAQLITISPKPELERDFIDLYWGLVSGTHDIAVPVQRFKDTCIEFFRRYFGEEIIFNTTENLNLPLVDILDHPRFPIYKNAITNLYTITRSSDGTRHRDWLEIVFHRALGKEMGHSTVGSLILVHELEPHTAYQGEDNIWRLVENHLKHQSSQPEIALLLPAYIAHAVAFSDLPKLKQLWEDMMDKWNDRSKQYFNKIAEGFQIQFESYPLSYLLGLLETILEPNDKFSQLEGIIKDKSDISNSDVFFDNHSYFYVEHINITDSTCITLDLRLWENNIANESIEITKVDVIYLYNRYRDFYQEIQKKTTPINSGQWTLYTRQQWDKKTKDKDFDRDFQYQEIFCSSTKSLTDYNNLMSFILSPTAYKILHMLWKLEKFTNSFKSEILCVKIRFVNFRIDNEFLIFPDSLPTHTP